MVRLFVKYLVGLRLVLKSYIFLLLFPENTLNLVESRRGLFPLTFRFSIELHTFFMFHFRKWNEILNSQNNPNLSLFKDSDTKIIRWFKDQKVNLLLDSLVERTVSTLFTIDGIIKLMDWLELGWGFVRFHCFGLGIISIFYN